MAATFFFSMVLEGRSSDVTPELPAPPYGMGLDLGPDGLYSGTVEGSELPSFLIPPAAPGSIARQTFLYDVYYRLWVFPTQIEMRNPQVGVDIPLAIWNAFPSATTLLALDAVGGEGLSFDIDTGDILGAYEYRPFNLQLSASAPLVIDVLFTFAFTVGDVTFRFVASRASIIATEPEVPVVETWEWLTDVQVSDNGTEQRVGLRSVPRRRTSTRMLFMTAEEIQASLNQLLNDIAGSIVIPYFPYATMLTAHSPEGTDVLYFDPNRTDVRVGESIVVLTRDRGTQLSQILAINADGATLDATLDRTLEPGDIAMPGFISRVEGRPALNRHAVNEVAELGLITQVLQPRAEFPRPGNTAVVSTVGGLPVLDRRPLAESPVPEVFDTGVRVIDFGTGVSSAATNWNHTRVDALRQYKIRRIADPLEMDWWRNFLELIRGQLRPFLTPTFRPDVFLALALTEGAGEIVLTGSDYGTLYWPNVAYRRLRLWTAGGPVDVTVRAVHVNEDGNTACTLEEPLPLGEAFTQVDHISYLLRVRLAADTVQLEHFAHYSILSLAFRTTSQ